jgi:hypothetical protein
MALWPPKPERGEAGNGIHIMVDYVLLPDMLNYFRRWMAEVVSPHSLTA